MTPAPFADRLLQLHIAEYTALTNRSTYYIAIAASLPLVLLVLLTLVIAIWNASDHVLLIWTTGLGVQFYSIALIDNSRWQYENIKYIEKTLRPLIEPLVDSSSAFWRYERYLSDRRRGIQWWELTPILWAVVAVIATFVIRLNGLAHPTNPLPVRYALTALDWSGAVVNILCLAVVIYNSVRIVALRRSIFQ
jgi:hypothetical protein